MNSGGRFLVCCTMAEGRVLNHPDRRTGRKARKSCYFPIIHLPCMPQKTHASTANQPKCHPRILLKTRKTKGYNEHLSPAFREPSENGLATLGESYA
jgi:hypothetical protein